MIRFLINQELVTLSDSRADLTLLQFIREHRKLTGTKEGCAAGDCGACTLVLAELSEDGTAMHYRTVNSCITLMSAVQGKQLIAVEHLSTDGQLHPVQQALVDHHGSQCGFCTPGFIMSMFALYHNAQSPNRDDVLHALSGNLCRCTGYRPIIDATLAACEGEPNDIFKQREEETITRLKALNEQTEGPLGSSQLLMPTSREALATAIAQNPHAPLVAGCTDLGLTITQQLKDTDTLISLSGINALKGCTTLEHSLLIGAATALSDLTHPLLTQFPQLAEIITRFASLPIRNQATLGGNVANASPIGDMPPVLIALGAQLHIDNGSDVRIVPIKEFFTGYRTTTLKQGEWISAIEIPFLAPHNKLAAYKISKRMEDDISAVCAVFNITVVDGIVTRVQSGFGGVAATPATSDELEHALVGKTWCDAECLTIGKQILANAFTPIDDVRASAEYRNTVLSNLWHRFYLEHQAKGTIETRVVAQHA
ncbi:xanthine dehydrogenase small subunit [Alteromonas sp. 345S023]|uniref:Xanthine dehydrogenase small subunit n=1 Tax=Alteromonas profundi TaxID=2696062 RepID=A0A7X5LJ37_9ALTE|nr:xanthine dehydrogenase small subunit [Alteromonas profundi]NDV89914.1 xanthine dehydrogenase small subunit [Alteromonas profundi]